MTIDELLQTAAGHHDAGRLAEAEKLYRQVLECEPGDVDALHYLGLVCFQTGRHAEALGLLEQAAAGRGDDAEIQAVLGTLLWRQGRKHEAVEAHRRAIEIKPEAIEVWCSLTMELRELGRMDEAMDVARQAATMRPDFAPAQTNLGLMLQGFGQNEAAVEVYRRAIELGPELPLPYNNLAIALLELGRTDESIGICRKVLAILPDFADAWNTLGNALGEQRRFEQSAEAFRKALAIRPNHADALSNLGHVLLAHESMEAGMACYEQSLAIRPNAGVHSNLIYMMLTDARRDAQEILSACRAWDERHGKPVAGAGVAYGNDRSPDRRLRIGYIAPNFRGDAVGWNLVPLLVNHDHEALEITCYNAGRQRDEVTERFVSFADRWRDIAGIPDERAAEMIRGDHIDILVDLGMHTAGSRLLVVARKPAPVQVAFVAYPGTTGLSAIDYRLTDPYLDPPGMYDADYSETSVRLPRTFWCFDGSADARLAGLVPNALPALSVGYVTFGCLNNPCKIGDATLELWARVLAAVPGSKLLMMSPVPQRRQRVLAKLGAGNSDDTSVEFADSRPRAEYLRIYNRIDIGLDTMPYNGHTTGLESLWMGVPMVTRPGRTAVSRAGLSLLSNLGLSALVAESDEQFVEIASQLAGDLPRLAELRAGLRSRMERSPLMDGKGFARDVETAYREMWRRWCAQ